MPNQRRQPKGIPIGGQFAEGRKPSFDLSPDSEKVRSREEQLIAGLGLRATVVAAGDKVRVTSSGADLDTWWERKFATGEYSPGLSPRDVDFKKMPDDYTPSMTSGRGTTDHRRTHRMQYVGPEVSLRMPSYTSINRFASENPGETFDIPITAEYPGGAIEGWVRVNRGENGTWRTKGLGFTTEQTPYIDEAVSCVLEARRPTRALSSIESLVESRRKRFADYGILAPQLPTSTWIKQLGYDHATGTMVMETESGKSYGYNVPVETYRAIALAHAPGKVFQKFKNRMERIEVMKCPTCGRHTVSKNHKCPPTMSAPRNDQEVRDDTARIRRRVGWGRRV
jgi:hypothetical protein